MNAVIKINTADLTEQVIHDLKEKYGSAELEIHVRSELIPVMTTLVVKWNRIIFVNYCF